MSSVQNHSRWVELSDGVNSAVLTLYEALQYSQTFENIGGNILHRTLDGTGVKQTNWSKIKTTLSGSGGLPLGFTSLDYSGVITMKCGVQRSVTSASNVIAIPAGRRADSGYTPVAKKRVDGFFVDAVVSMVGNTATVTLDAAAEAYMVLYFPEINVFMNDPSESFDVGAASTGWSITAEEF